MNIYSAIGPPMLTYLDAIRWWGAIAGVIGMSDVWRWYRRPPPRTATPNIAWLALTAWFLLCVFLVLLGTSIPLTSRIASFGASTAKFMWIVAVGWTCVSLSGWCFVIARAEGAKVMIFTAALAIGGTGLAAMLTAHV